MGYKNPNYKEEWREKNREHLRLQAKDYWKENRSKLIAQRKESRRQIRKLALKKLGGKCVICGETDWRCLQIDHIHGGGTKERKKLDSRQICNKILKMSLEEVKKTYQLLCANHNFIKRYEKMENI